MRPTIKDVAKAANVSIATVSFVLHNNERISSETKRRVLKSIKQLNYHPSRSARGLVSRKTGNIGFILTEEHFLRTEPFYTKIFLGTEFEARTKDYYVLFATVNSSFSNVDTLPRFILERNFDGIEITDSALITPIKLVSGIIGLGENVKKKAYTCNICTMENCYLRVWECE
ncbi:MAG: LacI family DNA-binding transcriptional regulator [Candidatus Neomarinimicrobiota bacterium]